MWTNFQWELAHLPAAACQMTSTILKTFNQVHQIKIKVANGSNMAIKGKGNVMWKLEDDEGVVHKISIKNTICVLTLEHYLLSPSMYLRN